MRARRCSPQPTCERGLTLIEVLLATLLLSLVILASVSVLTLTLKQNRLARNRTVATGLAVERVDRLTAQRFYAAADFAAYALPGETTDTGPPLTLSADYGSIEGYPDFRRVVTLNYQVPVAGMLRVSSEVFWRDPYEGLKSHKVVTYLESTLEQNP